MTTVVAGERFTVEVLPLAARAPAWVALWVSTVTVPDTRVVLSSSLPPLQGPPPKVVESSARTT